MILAHDVAPMTITPGWQSRSDKARAIIRDVCAANKMTREELFPPSRRGSRIAEAIRQGIYWRLREELHLTLSQIGAITGRDHSSVWWGLQQHQRRMGGQG